MMSRHTTIVILLDLFLIYLRDIRKYINIHLNFNGIIFSQINLSFSLDWLNILESTTNQKNRTVKVGPERGRSTSFVGRPRRDLWDRHKYRTASV